MFYVLGECTAIAVLVYQVVVIVGSEHLDELYDIGMVDFGQDADLVIGKLAQFGRMFEFVHTHNLHCK